MTSHLQNLLKNGLIQVIRAADSEIETPSSEVGGQEYCDSCLIVLKGREISEHAVNVVNLNRINILFTYR